MPSRHLGPSKPAASVRYLHPRTLSSGPESGLANQIYALVGYAILSKSMHLDLVLPSWASHDQNGTSAPFESLFEPSAMVRALASCGIVVHHFSGATTFSAANTLRPHAMAGWDRFKAFTRERLSIGFAHPFQHLEDAVFGGLRLAGDLQRRADALARLSLIHI